jgi:hypothetical protein
MIKIQHFWEIDDHIKSKWGKKFYNHIDYCGLEPVRPLKHYGYFCTPKNSLTFASTGGDGVHFGFLDRNNLNETPIVMTVPMSDNYNVIVAEDLEEFFSIGYYVGWFALEQLVYDQEETIEYFSKPDEETDDKELRFLGLIRDKFQTQHRPLTLERLDELKDKYFDQIEISEF